VLSRVLSTGVGRVLSSVLSTCLHRHAHDRIVFILRIRNTGVEFHVRRVRSSRALSSVLSRVPRRVLGRVLSRVLSTVLRTVLSRYAATLARR
jgi:hypothetical protein